MRQPDWQTIGEAAVAVLTTAGAAEKAATARAAAAAWRAGSLAATYDTPPPDRPARPARPELLLPADMPKRRKAGTADNRRALIHAVAHIELNAIDLAFDIVARFGGEMPRAFTDDWIGVGDDEARHFGLLSARLAALDCTYGDLPAHDGLWQAATATAHDIAARLAVVPMVLEARGLDVTPQMIDRFARLGDAESAAALQTIYDEEVGHVEAGSRWFHHLCAIEGAEPEEKFQSLVRTYFKGLLKRPFNRPARDSAGLPFSFYDPLADMLL
ncbi:ferritin-like domain-containing protein [Gimibacter soli]|uniref:Ferritin-like domain-containing protein n=1 Tax=Gimibacter soli TaxID=3024400 RepID=A0AAE9XRT1_9PROT|nr:ferritin-like domain-containing protein [Gimibacter soli]WCL52775.1 ferritin-like domain-containing protein [Gimibacter soli]